MLTALARRTLERLLAARGYQMRYAGLPPRGFANLLELAKSRGLAPKTVFDVGVGYGTPWLYDAFPDSKLVLFEPLAVFHQALGPLIDRLDADLHQVALSSSKGEVSFNRNRDTPTSSSMLAMEPDFAKYAEKVQRPHSFEVETVPTDRLDNLNTYEPPFVLKVDVEGAELMVLEGAGETLANTELLVLEISVMRRQTTEPSFAETIAALDNLGFELYDLPDLSQVKNNGPLLYVDAAFVPKGSRLWAEP